MLFLSWIEKKIRNLQPSICSSGSKQKYGRSLSAYTLPIWSFHNASDKINIPCGNHLCEVDNVACQEKFAFISFRYILSSNDCLGEFCRKCPVTGGWPEKRKKAWRGCEITACNNMHSGIFSFATSVCPQRESFKSQSFCDTRAQVEFDRPGGTGGLWVDLGGLEDNGWDCRIKRAGLKLGSGLPHCFPWKHL